MCGRFDRSGGEQGKSADPKRRGTSLAVGWSMEARRILGRGAGTSLWLAGPRLVGVRSAGPASVGRG